MPRGNDQYLTEVDVRTAMMDIDPSKNVLLDALEFTPEQIRAALTHAVDYWNEVPPDIGYCDYVNFPYRYHLLRGVCGHLLRTAAVLMARNAMDVQITGGTINDNTKRTAYLEMGERAWGEYREFVARKKLEISQSQAWGLV